MRRRAGQKIASKILAMPEPLDHATPKPRTTETGQQRKRVKCDCTVRLPIGNSHDLIALDPFSGPFSGPAGPRKTLVRVAPNYLALLFSNLNPKKVVYVPDCLARCEVCGFGVVYSSSREIERRIVNTPELHAV
jgi:hypothetical protein